MNRIMYIAIDIFSTAVITIPISLLIFYFVLKVRDYKKYLMISLFLMYITGVLSAVGIPDIRSLTIDQAFNVIPFVGIISNTSDYLKNEVLNIILFIPLGIFLPLIWRERFDKRRKVIIFALLFSCVIEAAQIFTYRLPDVDDLITNVFGAVIGYQLIGRWKDKITFFSLENHRIYVWIQELSAVFVPVILVMFFILPFLV